MPAKSTTKKQTATPQAEQAPTKASSEKMRLDDSALIRVKSNTFGTLIYINKRTGDRTEWSGFGDEQLVTMADLRAMKGTQNAFFSDNMIVITGCQDPRYTDVTPGDIYDALLVSRYYKNILDPDRFDTIFSMSDSEIRERVGYLTSNAKLNLVVALNRAVQSGQLDSLRKIRLFEELLGCELAQPK